MEEAAIGAVANLIDDIRLEIDVERTRHVFARRGLGEEGAEAIIVLGRRIVRKTTIGLQEC